MSSQPSGQGASVGCGAGCHQNAGVSSEDAALNGLLNIIAGGCNSTLDGLRRTFPSQPDLQLLASADSTVKTTVFNQLSLDIMRLVRLDAVMQYLRRGGQYQVCMTIETIKDFNRRMSDKRQAPSSLNPTDSSSASPSSLSSSSSIEPTSSISSISARSRVYDGEECHRNESDEVTSLPPSSLSLVQLASPMESKPASLRVNGGEEWQRSDILDGVEVEIDKADRKYMNDAVKVICRILEKAFGARLNIARSANVYANGKELRIEFRCKAYSCKPVAEDSGDESDAVKRCPFHVKVTTILEDGSTFVEFKGRHHCNETWDYSAKRDGLTRSQKDWVKEKLAKGEKPMEIYKEIVGLGKAKREENGLIGNDGDFPKLKQIQTYQKNCEDWLQAKETRVKDLENLCKQHSEIPSEPDEPFVIGYRVSGTDDFDFAISTPRLLEKFDESDRRNLDATYKHARSGFPITVAGVDDAVRKHHRAVVGVSSNENWKNFEFLSRSQIMHEKTSPTKRRRITLLADSAGAIRNGVRKALAGRKRKKREESTNERKSFEPAAKKCKPSLSSSYHNLASSMSSSSSSAEPVASTESTADCVEMLACLTTEGELLNEAVTKMAANDTNADLYVTACYFHMKQAFEKNVSKIKDRERYEAEINDDLEDLHKVPYPYEAAFDTALQLFFEKWISCGEAEFVAYFKKHWGGETRRWARAHHPPGYASVNNGLESHNGWMHVSGGYARRNLIPLFGFLLQEMRVASERARQEGGIASPKDRPKVPVKYWKHYRSYRRQRENGHGMLETPSSDGSKVYYPSSVSVTKWVERAEKELEKDDEYSRANDLTRRTMVTKHVAKCRDEALKKFIDFERALESGDRDAFSQLPSPVTSFDRFKKRLDSFHVVTKLPSDEKRDDMSHGCTCPKFQDVAYCKHGLNEGIKAKLVVDPDTLKMERKPKRGRPAKAKKRALTRQPGEYMSDSSEDEEAAEAVHM